MRGAAFRYLGQQVLDRTGPRILVAWIIVGAICLPVHFLERSNPLPPLQVTSIAQSIHFQVACIAMLALFHGIVAEDRSRGYYRFYLAKPVSPLWFYGQSHLVAILAMLVFTAGYLVIFSLAVAPAWRWELLVPSATLGILVGSLVFALSTVTTRDWILMIVIVIALSVTRHRFPADKSTLGAVLNAVLPPNHLVGVTTLTAAQWAWVGGWGLAFFLAGLAVLRFRPLGED